MAGAGLLNQTTSSDAVLLVCKTVNARVIQLQCKSSLSEGLSPSVPFFCLFLFCLTGTLNNKY